MEEYEYENETWKPCRLTDGLEASTYGRIRKISTGRVCTVFNQRSPKRSSKSEEKYYQTVWGYGLRYMVHRLVAEAYDDNYYNAQMNGKKCHIQFIDGNTLNCRPDNLISKTTARKESKRKPRTRPKAETQSKATLCWKCARANARHGCCWADKFEPVEGWKAIPTLKQGKFYPVHSFMVIKCPLFVPDSEKESIKL